jgi:hypothetical protein
MPPLMHLGLVNAVLAAVLAVLSVTASRPMGIASC